MTIQERLIYTFTEEGKANSFGIANEDNALQSTMTSRQAKKLKGKGNVHKYLHCISNRGCHVITNLFKSFIQEKDYCCKPFTS